MAQPTHWGTHKREESVSSLVGIWCFCHDGLTQSIMGVNNPPADGVQQQVTQATLSTNALL
jgi:hypothetical protein